MEPRLEAAVRAFVEEMIPSDDLPGAKEAGTAAELLPAIEASPELAAGMQALDRASRGAYGLDFGQASGEQRRALMGALSRGEQPPGWAGPPPGPFWAALRNLSLSLFYGSEVSREVTGFPGPSVDRGGWRHTIVEPNPR